MERNGFKLKNEDFEAILRRVDHNANHQIGYDEFSEMIGVYLTARGEKDKLSDASKSA
jgi:hypothetical protein